MTSQIKMILAALGGVAIIAIIGVTAMRSGQTPETSNTIQDTQKQAPTESTESTPPTANNTGTEEPFTPKPPSDAKSTTPQPQTPPVKSDSTPPKPAEQTTTPKTVSVQYSDSGYAPASVRIKAGDTVVFTNNSTTDMWTASDPHPSHIGYPEFDAKRRVGIGEIYSFTFTKKGTWGYHNHLNPGDRGTVIVE